MKKQLLLAATIAVSISAVAQNRMISDRAVAPLKAWQVAEPTTSFAPQGLVQKNGVNPSMLGLIGTGPNALGMGFGAKTQVWTDPILNTIIVAHRNDVGVNGGSSGDIRLDISTDGGATFAIDQLFYDVAGTAGFPARYPQAAIYNPAGNTTPTNAFGALACPSLDASNGVAGGFGGYVFPSLKLDLTTPGLSTLTTDLVAGIALVVPNDMMIAKTGEMYMIAPSTDQLIDYLDNMIFTKGIWDGGTNKYNYTHTLIPAPVELNAAGAKILADHRMAFGDGGQIGYFVLIGHDSYIFSPDSTYYPIVYKTTDGGSTWAGPTRIDLGNMFAALNGGVDGDVISTAFEADVTVDVNNNLHIAVDVAFGGGFSIATAAGDHAICDIYTTDGGTTWYGQAMGQPQTFRGSYGDATTQVIAEDNRPQISRSWDGTKVFVSWSDTDTSSFPGVGNTYPDVYVRGFDPAAITVSPVVNNSGGTAENMMAVASYYALTCGGSDYTVPCAAQIISGATPTGEPLNTLSQVQYKYYADGCVTDASYAAAAPILLEPTSVSDLTTITASTINVMPNPTSDVATISYLVSSATDVKVNIVNILGDVVASYNEGTQTTGVHQIKVDVSKYAAGVYTVNFVTGKETATAKFIVK
jgi:Secretion system C-terminal sorting domain